MKLDRDCYDTGMDETGLVTNLENHSLQWAVYAEERSRSVVPKASSTHAAHCPVRPSKIALDLDALLEQEEDKSSPFLSPSERNNIQVSEFDYPLSLPPPPRKPRNSQKMSPIVSSFTNSPTTTFTQASIEPPVLPPLNLLYTPAVGAAATTSLEDALSELLTPATSDVAKPDSLTQAESSSPTIRLPSAPDTPINRESPPERPLEEGSPTESKVAALSSVVNAFDGGQTKGRINADSMAFSMMSLAESSKSTAAVYTMGTAIRTFPSAESPGGQQNNATMRERTGVLTMFTDNSLTPGEEAPAVDSSGESPQKLLTSMWGKPRPEISLAEQGVVGLLDNPSTGQTAQESTMSASLGEIEQQSPKLSDEPDRSKTATIRRFSTPWTGHEPQTESSASLRSAKRRAQPSSSNTMGELNRSVVLSAFKLGKILIAATRLARIEDGPFGGQIETEDGDLTYRHRTLLSHESPLSPSPPPSAPAANCATSSARSVCVRSSLSFPSNTLSPAASSVAVPPPASPRSHQYPSLDPSQSFIELTPSQSDFSGAIQIITPTEPTSPSPLSMSKTFYGSRTATKSTPGSRTHSPTPNNRDDGSGQNWDDLPPTTNFLDLDERADLIRKSRKLAQLFGQPPSADVLAQQESRNPALKRGHQRGALSLNDHEIVIVGHKPISLRPPAVGNGRRYSNPLSPDEVSFLGSVTHDKDGESNSISNTGDGDGKRAGRQGSLTSFIDLSEEEEDKKAGLDKGREVGETKEGSGGAKEAAADRRDGEDHHHHARIPSSASAITISTLSTTTPKLDGRRRPSSPTSQSLFENMTPEERAEEDRRRKREKLAKLHRFLGSRVPADLVLGIDIPPPDSMLPPAAFDSAILGENDDPSRSAWIRRRRSSSAAAFPTWLDDVDRMKDDLGDKEKAINVRRAQKMERVFGVAPPQALYHTRQSPASSSAPIGHIPGYIDATASSPSNVRNPNQSAYMRSRARKSGRPGTADSATKHLLSKSRESNEPHEVARPPRISSLIYNHYQHSLNSLDDIIDRDDKESLAELHEYLNSGDIGTTPFTMSNRSGDRRASNMSTAPSTKSERRHSLPARTSIISLSSEYSVASAKPEPTDFQLRRRRAAKLTHFFGVDYRDLIRDVLESIENGLEHERKRGTLNAEEVEDLLHRLRKLRVKRDGAI
ncbi:hypothetical protein AX16_000505 [Volvariella volvacea WC 439]|nr:hypothetical protein AX16_000505 [Volvariella volvacea WC 439]